MNRLALEAGRHWQSDETGFVHYHPHRSEDEIHRSIPAYENFLFALALLNSRLSDNIQEAKQLLTRLLPFQTDSGNFSIFLHHFPICYDRKQGSKIYAPIHWTLKNFHKVLGQELIEKLKVALNQLQEPTEDLVSHQIAGIPIPKEILDQWHLSTCSRIGPSGRQKGFEPEVTRFDLYMATFSEIIPKRFLTKHPALLEAALIQPEEVQFDQTSPFASYEGDAFKLIWGTPERVHSLVREGGVVYIDAAEGLKITVEGTPATTFQTGQIIQAGPISLSLEQEGQVMGHIMRGNRNSQIDKRFTGYDWMFFLRPIRNAENHQARVSIRWE